MHFSTFYSEHMQYFYLHVNSFNKWKKNDFLQNRPSYRDKFHILQQTFHGLQNNYKRKMHKNNYNLYLVDQGDIYYKYTSKFYTYLSLQTKKLIINKIYKEFSLSSIYILDYPTNIGPCHNLGRNKKVACFSYSLNIVQSVPFTYQK